MRNIICDKSGDIICEDMNTDVYRFNERIEDEFGSYSFLYFSFFTKDFFIGDESTGEDFTLKASKQIKEFLIRTFCINKAKKINSSDEGRRRLYVSEVSNG